MNPRDYGEVTDLSVFLPDSLDIHVACHVKRVNGIDLKNKGSMKSTK